MFFAYPCESALVWVGFSPVHPCRGDFERAVWLQNQGSSLRRRFFPRKRLFKEEGDKTNAFNVNAQRREHPSRDRVSNHNQHDLTNLVAGRAGA